MEKLSLKNYQCKLSGYYEGKDYATDSPYVFASNESEAIKFCLIKVGAYYTDTPGFGPKIILADQISLIATDRGTDSQKIIEVKGKPIRIEDISVHEVKIQ